MTDKELMLLDAEYWLGYISAKELKELLADDGWFARVRFFESEYGLMFDAMDNFQDLRGSEEWFSLRSWFSLLIGEATATILESAEGWPFPEVYGVIPE